MNQKARQKATCSIERDCYKLLNNSNFGIDCRNNIDTCFVELLYMMISQKFPILKNLRQLSMMIHLETFFSIAVEARNNSEFSISDILTEQRRANVQGQKKYYKREMEDELKAVDSYERKKQKNKEKKV